MFTNISVCLLLGADILQFQQLWLLVSLLDKVTPPFVTSALVCEGPFCHWLFGCHHVEPEETIVRRYYHTVNHIDTTHLLRIHI